MFMSVLLYILLLVCISVIFWLTYKLFRNSSDVAVLKERNILLETQLADKEAQWDKTGRELERIREEYKDMLQESGELKALNHGLKEMLTLQKEEVRKAREDMNNEFRVIATEILEDKSKKFRELNDEKLSEILNPLKERIDVFKKAVEDTYSQEARERFSLCRSIDELVKLNKTIGEEANQLTRALKGDSKIQGDWGEMILENILEKSGLEKNREYFLQETLKDSAGRTIQSEEGRRLRPDVIIKYPGERWMVIDSKVSLTAYVKYINASDKLERDIMIKEHVLSMRKHIEELSRKSYQDYLGKNDYVMMFVPNEAAYMSAMQYDAEMWQFAYDRRVLLLSPTNLIAALKLIADLWLRDKQTRNAIFIAEESGKLYDKFVGFVEDMERIGRNINMAQDSYAKAMKKLSTGTGNLISKASRLKEIGAKTSKSLSVESEEQE